ncbi:hypothetical protein BJ912DRAFT_920473 [Pholiota molesta]|nr:hypothetical protein BJ912DRAFT_920473 [Pholiota molesta]
MPDFATAHPLVFLHSCSTPETVFEFLAHMGISISTTSINEAVNNLTKEANAESTMLPLSGLNHHKHFNAWKILQNLVHHGPEYFHQFKRVLGDPEVVNVIPVTKTQQIPLRCIGDPIDNPQAAVPIGNRAVPIAGDLLMLQHDHSLQESRAEEATPWHRFQGLVSIMGLFHFKMACADAIWHIFIHPKPARIDADPTSLMAYVSEMCPKEMGKIKTKPGFHCMHEVIQHVGIASRLDLWWLEVKKRSVQHLTLKSFADSKPTWKDLCSMAEFMAQNYVANDNLYTLCEWPDQEHDKQYENALIQQQYFLLYKEL